jgi:guanosine-3',5'-bis(diphosphate) 3'-pyrophosphohydrolase
VKKSPQARLVSYADKLYNLRDLTRTTPEGWEEQRVQEYFQWSGKVLRNMLGANDKLEAELEKVLSSRGVTLYP